MDINIAFCRALLKATMQDVAAVTTAAQRAEAWTYHFHGDDWEFHGPDGFRWQGSADNAYHARQQGWSAYLAREGADA